MGVPYQNIVLYGRSIGSGPTCYLAENYPVAGVILQSAFLSICKVATRISLPFDKLKNINRVPNINCTIFVIHGKNDNTVSLRHGKKLHKKSKNQYPPLFIEGADHNNIEEFCPNLVDEINKFLNYLEDSKLGGEKNTVILEESSFDN